MATFPWQVNRAAKIPGNITKIELEWLVTQAQALSDGDTWVDIGTVVGRSFMAVALSLPRDCTLIAVDRNLGDHVREGQTFDGTYQEVVNRRPDLNVLQVRASVADAALFFRRICKFVYIDASREKAGFALQFTRWTNKLVTGGILAGHDYTIPSVQTVVDAGGGEAVENDMDDPIGKLWSVPPAA